MTMNLSRILTTVCVFVTIAGACDPALDDPGRAVEAQEVDGLQVVFVAPGEAPLDASELADDVLVIDWTPDTSRDLAAPADPAGACVWYPIAYDVWGPDVCGSCTRNGQPGAEYWVFMKDCSTCGACGAPYIRESCQPC
jgi:hypothetical protein